MALHVPPPTPPDYRKALMEIMEIVVGPRRCPICGHYGPVAKLDNHYVWDGADCPLVGWLFEWLPQLD
jgi:hypothetical protein